MPKYILTISVIVNQNIGLVVVFGRININQLSILQPKISQTKYTVTATFHLQKILKESIRNNSLIQ